MDQKEKTVRLLTEHFRKYPRLSVEDIFKFIFQSAYGCEHLVSDRAAAENYIRREYENVKPLGSSQIDELDGDYSRVHLSCLNNGISFETLSKLFCLSAKKEPEGDKSLLSKLDTADELIKSGTISLDYEDFNKKLTAWREMGFSAVHHSDAFREEYRPAYRVIANRFVEYLDVFYKIDTLLEKNDSVTVAVEGGSASGKSTLSEILSSVYDCNVFHMDDFFLRPEQRTRERFMEIGGNVDRERFTDEVIAPLIKGETVCYRPFDCSTQTLKDSVAVAPKKLTIVEGVYSTHPAFERYYDLSIFLDIDPEIQKSRILKRNSPLFAKRFFEEWIPLENVYFEKTSIRIRTDMLHTVQK